MNTRRYFGGHSATSRTIRQLPVSSFRELVEKHFKVPVALPLSRTAYHELSEDRQKEVKNGPYVIPAAMRDAGGGFVRRTEFAEKVNLVMLDLDPDPKGRSYVHEIFEAPQHALNQLHPFNAVIYQTASSTPEQPRIRVMVDVEDLDVEDYHAAVATIVHLLGLPADFAGKRESRVVVQPMYRPVQFQGEEFSAILACRLDGRAFDELDIRHDVGESSERKNYGHSGKGIDSDLTHLPVADLSVEDIVEPMNAIDPDCDYKTWIEVVAALVHQFRGEEEAFEALKALDEWSATAKEKYRGFEDVERKWLSYRPDPTGRNPVTIRTLFHHAKAAGWKSDTLATKIKSKIEDWIAACDDEDELMTEGPRRIAEVPFQNAILTESLAKALQARLQIVGGRKITVPSILKVVRQAKREKANEERSETAHAWAMPWCYVATSNRFVQAATGHELVTEAFDKLYAVELLGTNEDGTEDATYRPSARPSDFALNKLKIPKVMGTTYDPTHLDADPYITDPHTGVQLLNRFRPATLPALDTVNAKKVGAIFQEHCRKVVGEAHFRTVIDFFAYPIQNPGAKVRWAIALQGAEGCGKNMLVEMVMSAMGRDNTRTVGPDVVASEWNDWMFGCTLVLIDEFKIPGKNRSEFINKLKAPLTNDVIARNKKFEDSCDTRIFANFVILTNFIDALHLNDTSRRFMALKSPIQRKAQVTELQESGWFGHVKRVIDEHGGALRQWLLDWKISEEFDPNASAPHTAFLDEIVESSKNRLLTAIEDLIDDPAEPLIDKDVIWYPQVEDRTVAESRNNHPPSHFLSELGYVRYAAGKRFEIGGKRGQIWIGPDFDTDLDDPVEKLSSFSLDNPPDL